MKQKIMISMRKTMSKQNDGIMDNDIENRITRRHKISSGATYHIDLSLLDSIIGGDHHHHHHRSSSIDSMEENLRASIESCNICLSSFNDDNDEEEDDDDMYDSSFVLLDDNNDESDCQLHVTYDILDSDTVPSTDLQSSLSHDEIGSTSSSSHDNSINSRKEIYLKIIRNEIHPRPIKYKRSFSDDMFYMSYVSSLKENYY
jgi:hypothetical protein